MIYFNFSISSPSHDKNSNLYSIGSVDTGARVVAVRCIKGLFSRSVLLGEFTD